MSENGIVSVGIGIVSVGIGIVSVEIAIVFAKMTTVLPAPMESGRNGPSEGETETSRRRLFLGQEMGIGSVSSVLLV